jgi:hypothetical protein
VRTLKPYYEYPEWQKTAAILLCRREERLGFSVEFNPDLIHPNLLHWLGGVDALLFGKGGLTDISTIASCIYSWEQQHARGGIPAYDAEYARLAANYTLFISD